MPLSDPINSAGVQFHYEDSGAPSSAVYTTLVAIHGSSYHSAIFAKLLPLAARHNLRLVLLNRRDYPGSTPVSQDELEKIRSDNLGVNAAVLRELGLQIASFIAWYARTASIPQVQIGVSGEPEGGLSVLAWSSGNATTSAAIANLAELEEEQKACLKGRLRTYIIYDSPSYIFGIPQDVALYNPFRDPSLKDAKAKSDVFNVWVTMYYQHPNPDSGSLSGLSFRGIENPPPEKIATYHRFRSDHLAEVSCPEALMPDKGEGNVRYMPIAVWDENITKLFCDPRGTEEFPDLKIKLIWCRESNPDMPWGAGQLKGKAHWDLPEETIEFWSSIV
ncbi:hypothetical protein OE88DRAFT_1626342 [Heliocybe sulcata]|uniref:AB hydrolase-1 domain-containing protein n=1 Tax=Heliocybe sulcata TaxID=5364 RepID=A0A5C3N834_9AGAM|nr:hypothetical protein OE88DRAFT_1626342 [Heliocybe sulcata]